MVVDSRLGERERADVVVIGGGPAGARAAARLAGEGLRVVLLERGGPDRLKPCAGGMPESVFRRLDLDAGLVECRPQGYRFIILTGGRPARGLGPAGPRRSARVLEWPGFPFVVVRRQRFDRALREEAARRGCEVRCSCQVVGWDRQGLLLRQGPRVDSAWSGPSRAAWATARRGQHRRLRARCYLWANGASGASVRPRGLGFRRRPGNFALAWAAEVEAAEPVDEGGALEFFVDRRRNPFGYFWRFPVRGGFNLGAGTAFGTAGRRSLQQRSTRPSAGRLRGAFDWWLDRALAGGGRRLVWVRAGVIPIWPAARLVRGVHLAVGDAGGLVNPVNGEGIQYALASADAAAEAVLEAFGTGRLDRLADYPRRLWGQGPFLRLGLLAMGLRGLLALGRRGRRSLYPELVELSHLLFRLRGWLRCSSAN